MEQYAQCIACKRWLELECFERIEDYSNGHILPGGFHHQVMCITCRLKAIEASNRILEEGDWTKDDEDVKVGGTD